MKMIYCRIVLLIFFLGMSSTVFAEQTLTIPGTGDNQDLLRKIAAIFQKQHPGTKVKIPDSIGSGGGIKSVSRGKVALGRTARPLKDHEKNGMIEYLFAVSPIVFAVNNSVQDVKNITNEQLIGIYNGEINNWKQMGGHDNKIFPISREPGDSSLLILENHIKGYSSIKSVGKVFYTTPDAAQAIAEHNYTIGYVPKGFALENGLTALSFNGVEATEDNLKSGEYPLATPYYIVSKGEPTGLAAAFMNFLASDEAKAIIFESGATPTL